MRNISTLVAVIILAIFQVAELSANEAVIEFYTLPGCRDCEEYEAGSLTNLRQRLRTEGIETRLLVRNVLVPEDFKELSVILAERGLTYGGIPIIVAAGIVLKGNDLNEDVAFERLHAAFGAARGAARGAAPPLLNPEYREVDISISLPPLWVVVGAGLADGINPCAMAVLVFLISALALSGKNRSTVLPVGMGFTFGVFLSYLLMGFGLLGVAGIVSRISFLSTLLRWGTILALILLSALSVRDAVLCAAGRVSELTLKMPAAFTAAAHSLIRSKRNAPLAAGAAFLLGGTVSIIEFVCTGQVYLPTIVYIARTAPTKGTGLLLAYNFAFIVPLVVVFILVHFGISHASVSGFFRRHLIMGKGIMATVFTLLAVALFLR